MFKWERAYYYRKLYRNFNIDNLNYYIALFICRCFLCTWFRFWNLLHCHTNPLCTTIERYLQIGVIYNIYYKSWKYYNWRRKTQFTLPPLKNLCLHWMVYMAKNTTIDWRLNLLFYLWKFFVYIAWYKVENTTIDRERLNLLIYLWKIFVCIEWYKAENTTIDWERLNLLFHLWKIFVYIVRLYFVSRRRVWCVWFVHLSHDSRATILR